MAVGLVMRVFPQARPENTLGEVWFRLDTVCLYLTPFWGHHFGVFNRSNVYTSCNSATFSNISADDLSAERYPRKCFQDERRALLEILS